MYALVASIACGKNAIPSRHLNLELNKVGNITSGIISGKPLKTSGKASLSQGSQPPPISYSPFGGNLSHPDFEQEIKPVWCQF